MPNMDGTGPRFTGQFMGRGAGRRGGAGYGRYGGAGRGFAGCRCGFGPCATYVTDEKSALEARKDALNRSLDDIEKRLETL